MAFPPEWESKRQELQWEGKAKTTRRETIPLGRSRMCGSGSNLRRDEEAKGLWGRRRRGEVGEKSGELYVSKGERGREREGFSLFLSLFPLRCVPPTPPACGRHICYNLLSSERPSAWAFSKSFIWALCLGPQQSSSSSGSPFLVFFF